MIGQTPAAIVTLNRSVVPGVNVSASDVQLVHIVGGPGDDILRLDESNGAMPACNFDGDAGRDLMLGGSHPDTLVGGAGIDRSDGGPATTPSCWEMRADQFT